MKKIVHRALQYYPFKVQERKYLKHRIDWVLITVSIYFLHLVCVKSGMHQMEQQRKIALQ